MAESNGTVKKLKYLLRFIPDKLYLQIYYFLKFKKPCNLKNPTTFNEKLNWLKLYDRNPLYTRIVDKYEVKQYASEIIGWDYCIPTLGLWNSFDEIDFNILPKQFVLKCTHDNDGLIIVGDKNKLDMDYAKAKLTKSLQENFYYIGREWPYKNVKPRIIAEQYMKDERDGELRDYKFFCFDGEPKMMYVASERNTGSVKFDFYDMEFNHVDIVEDHPNASYPLRKPDTFDEMKVVARRLSAGFPHLRVDFYEVNGRLYLGELTLFHYSGFAHFVPEKWDYVLGNWLKLPNKRQ